MHLEESESWNTSMACTWGKEILEAKKQSLGRGWQLHSGDEKDGKSWRDQWRTRRLYRRPCLLSDSYHCHYHYQTNRVTVISRATGFGREKIDFERSAVAFFGMMTHTQYSDLFSPHTGNINPSILTVHLWAHGFLASLRSDKALAQSNNHLFPPNRWSNMSQLSHLQ